MTMGEMNKIIAGGSFIMPNVEEKRQAQKRCDDFDKSIGKEFKPMVESLGDSNFKVSYN